MSAVILGVIEDNSPYSKNKTQKDTIRDLLIVHTASPFEKWKLLLNCSEVSSPQRKFFTQGQAFW